MATPSDHNEKAELKVRAWELATGRGPYDKPLSSRQIARELGVSKDTANRYVREVEGMQDFVDLLDRAEAKVAQAVRLAEYVVLLRARIDEGRPAEQIMPALMKVEDRLGRLHRMDDLPAEDEQGRPLLSEEDQRLVAAIRVAEQHMKTERNGSADG